MNWNRSKAPASRMQMPASSERAEAREGIPPAVNALKDRIVACDGLLLATPEYNSGVPGVLKNGIDGLSRPANRGLAAECLHVLGDSNGLVFIQVHHRHIRTRSAVAAAGRALLHSGA